MAHKMFKISSTGMELIRKATIVFPLFSMPIQDKMDKWPKSRGDIIWIIDSFIQVCPLQVDSPNY